MSLSKRKFLQMLGAASAAGMGLGSYADTDAATARRRRVKARKINTPRLIGMKGNTGMAPATA
jgi:sulfur-oxidizing protein SoxB